MILIYFALLCLLTVPLTGGRLSRLASIRVRGTWVPVVALAIQVVITVNGGQMAASRTAERLAGLHVESGFENSAPLTHPHLLWFGDIIPWPGPHPNVLSIGDLLIYAGTLILLHRVCRRSADQPLVLRPITEPALGLDPAGELAVSRRRQSPH